MEAFTIDISDIVNNAMDKGLPDPSLLQLYRNIERRTFVWNEEVSDEILTLADYIMTYNFEDKDVEPEKRVPIKIFINTQGGDIDCAKHVIDMIELSKTPVYTIGMARCYSAGTYLLMAGHKRFVFKNTKALLHDGYTDIGGSIGKFSDTASFIEKDESLTKKYVLSHTKITEEEYDKNYRRDWFMFSDDIIKYGIADSILTDISEVF